MEIEVEVEVVIAMDGRDNKRLHEVVMIEVIKEEEEEKEVELS